MTAHFIVHLLPHWFHMEERHLFSQSYDIIFLYYVTDILHPAVTPVTPVTPALSLSRFTEKP